MSFGWSPPTSCAKTSSTDSIRACRNCSISPRNCPPADFREEWNGPGGGQPIVTRAENSRREHKTLIFFLVALEALAVVLLIGAFALGGFVRAGDAGNLRAARQYRPLPELVG